MSSLGRSAVFLLSLAGAGLVFTLSRGDLPQLLITHKPNYLV